MRYHHAWGSRNGPGTATADIQDNPYLSIGGASKTESSITTPGGFGLFMCGLELIREGGWNSTLGCTRRYYTYGDFRSWYYCIKSYCYDRADYHWYDVNGSMQKKIISFKSRHPLCGCLLLLHN